MAYVVVGPERVGARALGHLWPSTFRWADWPRPLGDAELRLGTNPA